MKKIGIYGSVFIPFLVALGIQIIVAGVYGFVSALLFFTGGGDYSTSYSSNELQVQLGITAVIAMIILIIFGIWYNKINYSKTKGELKKLLPVKIILGIVVLGIGLQITLNFILNIIASIKPEWFHNYGQVMEQLGRGNSILSLVYISIIAPLSEEVIFRGVTFKKAQKVMPFTGANILQAILFGVYHGNVVQGIYAFFLGLFLGFVCYKLNSLLAAILLHMAINLSGILFGYISTESIFYSTGVYSLVSITGIIIVIAGTAILLKNKKTAVNMN